MDAGKVEFVVVGSGAGGATLARELTRRGRTVLVVERGRGEQKVGTFADAVRFYDANRVTQMPARSREGVILWRAFMAGGTTVAACGNAVRCLEPELAEHGIDLANELAEAERDLRVCPIAEGLLSDGSLAIRDAATRLGYRMEPMPKVVDPVRCTRCAACPMGCANGAKWTAREYLEDAERMGAMVMYETEVVQVTLDHGTAHGITARGPDGPLTVAADVVILAAGGLATPLILQRSGITEAGRGLFVDLLVNTYAVTDGLNQVHEPVMALVDHELQQTEGLILSPHVNISRRVRFAELGPRGMAASANRLLGIMTKIVDEPAGEVHPDGSVSKPVTARDRARLERGSEIASEILVKAGARRDQIMRSRPQGAHPGGTAAVGTIVDSDLQTKVDGLFVCDGSVLPTAPGLPPILTIVALAKRLAATLAPATPAPS